MACAFLEAMATLIIPLIIRHITGSVVEKPLTEALPEIYQLGAVMIGLCLVQLVCQWYTVYFGHMVGTMQERDTVALNLTESHKTVKNIKARGAFTVSIADAAHVVEADYFGVESGNHTADKFKNSGLTASRSEAVDAPVINEFPLCLECRFIEYQNNDFGCGVIGKVVRVTADESVMEGDKLNMSLVNAIAFDPYTHGYYKVTDRIGEAFKDGLKLKK